MLKLGLDSYSYHLHLEDMDYPRDAFWFLRKVLALGLDGCHFDSRHLCGWDEQLVRDIGQFCMEHGLYIGLSSTGFDFPRMSRRLALATEVGARVVCTIIGSDPRTLPQERRGQLLADATEGLSQLGRVAEDLDIAIGVGNNEDLTSSEIIEILQAVSSPCVGACVDAANALTLWEDPVEHARALAPYAVSICLKDWKHWWEGGIPRKEGSVIGQGDASAAAVYEVLRKSKPDLPVTIRVPTVGPGFVLRTLEQEEANVVASIRFVREQESRLSSP